MRLLQAILNSESSGKNMKICRICGEEYQEKYEKCAFCGCPEDWSLKQNWKFPDEIKKGYELVKIFDTEVPFPDGLYWSKEKENVVCIYKLPATESGKKCLKFMECLSEAEEWYPEIYRIVLPEENTGGYYVCQYRPGETLEEVTEKENPPGVELSNKIINGIQELLQKTEEKDVNAGIFDLKHLQIVGETLVLKNLGPGDYIVSDRIQAEMLIRRIQKGWWDNEETVQVPGFWRKIFKRHRGNGYGKSK